MVMEKSWKSHRTWKICQKSWNFVVSHGILPILPQNYSIFLVNSKKLSSDLESPHFPMFSAKHCECKIGERNGHGKSRKGHGKVMDKYFVKSVGTLNPQTKYS